MWTDERVELLKKLHADGLSSSQIAGAMDCGFSRCAVLGKLNRLGMCKPRGEPRPKGQRKPRPRRTFNQMLIDLAKAREQAAAQIDAEPSLPPDQSDHAVKLIEAGEDNCRWPLGEPSHEMLVCGARPVNGLPYCLGHSAIAFRSQ